MITNTKINNWLREPETLQGANQAQLEQYAKEFPYFNLAQYLSKIGSTDAEWQNLPLRCPSHPVLKYILKSKYQKAYPKTFTYPTAEVLLQEDKEELIPEEVETATAIIEELTIAPPQQEYFKLEGLNISDELPQNWEHSDDADKKNEDIENAAQSLMVVMPFSEWLKYLSKLSIKEKAEEESKKSLRALWQKEKLASALEEETDEIPEEVFEMAVNSIVKKDDIVNESLAEVYVRQEKYQKAIDIYNKLSLLYPEKNTYFASKIEKLKKEL